MQQIKICPECTTEYYAHIEKCADCGTALLLPEENQKRQEEKKKCLGRTLKNQVVAREGDLQWMGELSHVLRDSGIPCAVRTDEGCKKGSCRSTHQLMVSSRDLDRAHERIEEYYAEIHPEIRASREMVSQGKCPACGGPVGPDAVACPDCGLTLLLPE